MMPPKPTPVLRQLRSNAESAAVSTAQNAAPVTPLPEPEPDPDPLPDPPDPDPLPLPDPDPTAEALMAQLAMNCCSCTTDEAFAMAPACALR